MSAHDPRAIEAAREIFGDRIEYCEDAYAPIPGADALVTCTEWMEYRSPDFDRLVAEMRQPLIFDGRNIWDAEIAARYGFEYFSVGRPPVAPKVAGRGRCGRGEIATGAATSRAIAGGAGVGDSGDGAASRTLRYCDRATLPLGDRRRCAHAEHDQHDQHDEDQQEQPEQHAGDHRRAGGDAGESQQAPTHRRGPGKPAPRIAVPCFSSESDFRSDSASVTTCDERRMSGAFR